MYDELIKALRNVADNSHYTAPELLKDAADAIEYLMRKLESRESALNSVVERLDNSTVAATDVLDTTEDRIG